MSKTVIVATTTAMLFVAASAALNAADAPRQLDARCWDQSFVDNFDTLSFWNADTNTGQWKTSYIWGSDIIINNELQYYIDPPTHKLSPFAIDNGILNITADKTPSFLLDQVKERPFISGVLTTENGFSQKYGRFEVYAKVPAGKGLWSAFWLLPSFDSWPEGVAVLPEIDVMEHLGHETRTYHTTVHTNQSGKLESYPYDHTQPDVLSDDYHLYSVVWNKDQVAWYLDNRRMATNATPSDFTEPVHFLLNLAVGGNWPGAPDQSTQFPATFSIDYVKAYTDSGKCK